MSSALVVYGSTTGNTEKVAEMINDVLADKGWDTVLKDVSETEAAELAMDFDLLLLGSSTWGDEDIEIQEDFAEFHEKMDSVKLNGKKVAVFGCGDSSYTHFCGAVDVIQGKSAEMGGVIVCESLKIDGDPEDAEDDILDWAAEVVKQAH